MDTHCATPNDEDSKSSPQSEYGTPDSSFTTEDPDTEDITSLTLSPPTPTVSPFEQVTAELAKEKRGRAKDQESLKEAQKLIAELEESLRRLRAYYDRLSEQLASSLAAGWRCVDFAKYQALAHDTEKAALVTQLDDVSRLLNEERLAIEHCNAEREKAEAEATKAQDSMQAAFKKFKEEKQVFKDERSEWIGEREHLTRTLDGLFDDIQELRDEHDVVSEKLDMARHRRDDDAEAIDDAIKSLQKISDGLRSRRESY